MHLFNRRFVIASLLFALLHPAGVLAGQEQPGARLFQSKGCSGCHTIGGQGGHVGPILDNVGDRLSAEWIYKWLKDPPAVKPDTNMPNLHLTDDERAQLTFYLTSLNSGVRPARPVVMTSTGEVKSNPPDLDPKSPENNYLDLGVHESYVKVQRGNIQDQIQSFIPPVYEPAVTESAFVLPPGALRVQLGYRQVGALDASDVAGQLDIQGHFNSFHLNRQFTDLDLVLGLDHNMTLRFNLPIQSSRMQAELNPQFINMISAFPQGSTSAVGDLSVFLKKKFVDQGNFPVGIAGVAGLRFPTGSNKEKFDPGTTASLMGMKMIFPFPAIDGNGNPDMSTIGDGIFRRFSNDGRLPAPLQPGLGTLGGYLGVFASRQLEGSSFFGRGALHVGSLYEIRPKADGVDPGDVVRWFVTFVKPIWHDNVSLDLTYLGFHQQTDSYDGKLFQPINPMATTGPLSGGMPIPPSMIPPMPGLPSPAPVGFKIIDRPSFSGGTTQFVSASVVVIPNPLFKVSLGALVRVAKPSLGPSPPYVINASFTYTFASGLYRGGE
ncbi:MULTISPECIES: c-type cytochrome [Rhodanobacter]|uniref:c-type cytochrome n=1 Tax=Rhodanobacter TaxID=75309 RepID=UPI0003FEB0F3|nr:MULTISPECIES: cytochrome c [Rhodanobacter]UJJ54112.1 cytochrome c [Rhodanobacter thiooxydans]